MKKLGNSRQKGITLIALVVTVVVLIILATVSILAVFGDNGIIARAQKVKDAHEEGKADEANTLEDYASYIDSYNPGVNIIMGNEKIKITKKNVQNYLGKIVTNYEPTVDTIKFGDKDYIVSKTYRLYYIDFEGKYGKKDTIYLKADYSGEEYSLSDIDTTTISSINDENVKLKELNPSLYAKDVVSPSEELVHMNKITFLTNANNWKKLGEGVDSEISNKINYVIGAPSLEMMVDSYNMCYELEDKEIETGELNENSNRAKLFYKYPYANDNKYLGYCVGPSNDSNNTAGYYYNTSFYTVKSDTKIDTMYYPGGESGRYWLSSPGANTMTYILQDQPTVMSVQGYGGGYIAGNSYYSYGAFCPLVSLKSTALLKLEE